MYCVSASAEFFIKHVFALVAPAACEDATSANTCDLFPQSRTLSALPNENDSQKWLLILSAGSLVTPALTIPREKKGLKTGFLGSSSESKKVIVENPTPRTLCHLGEKR